MDPQEQLNAIVAALVAVKKEDPTEEELLAIVEAIAAPILNGLDALQSIAKSLERLSDYHTPARGMR